MKSFNNSIGNLRKFELSRTRIKSPFNKGFESSSEHP